MITNDIWPEWKDAARIDHQMVDAFLESFASPWIECKGSGYPVGFSVEYEKYDAFIIWAMFIKELVLLLGPFGMLYSWDDAQYPHAEVAASTASQHTKILTQNAYTFQNTQLKLHNLKATSALALFKDA